MHAQRGLSYVCVHCWHWLAHPLRLPYAHTHTHTHTHTTRAGSCEIDIMEEASTCSPVDMYIQGQLVMLTETVASMVASMVATPMM